MLGTLNIFCIVCFQHVLALKLQIFLRNLSGIDRIVILIIIDILFAELPGVPSQAEFLHIALL